MMVRALRILAAIFLVAAVPMVFQQLPWSYERLGSDAVEPLLTSGMVIFSAPYYVTGLRSTVLMLVGIIGSALTLLALAGIVERLDFVRRERTEQAKGVVAPPNPPSVLTSIWNRIASARALRIVAVVAATAWVAVIPVSEALGYIWWKQFAVSQMDSGPVPSINLALVAVVSRSVTSALIFGAIALTLAALAGVSDRLDGVRGRIGPDR